MNLNKVDLNLFVVFDAIYTEANLTRAGQIVGITQPAVSNALARLRETFNDPLFVRTAQGMVPTPMAQNIIGPVRSAGAQGSISPPSRICHEDKIGLEITQVGGYSVGYSGGACGGDGGPGLLLYLGWHSRAARSGRSGAAQHFHRAGSGCVRDRFGAPAHPRHSQAQ
jgi:hypothetical protein